mmetsp:Transcript_96200/g.267280  ORF Transcript_96200/g.267280 Transcript_96200/m.267280 type:complete len:382 (-) Transcript_96200:303-1448(-)
MVHQAMGSITNSLIRSTGGEAYSGPFQTAFGRLFVAGGSGHQDPALLAEGLKSRWLVRAQAPPSTVGRTSLLDLAEGPCLFVAAHLGAVELCATDASCRTLRDLNRAHGGPWCALGSRMYYGLELDGDGVFEPVELEGDDQTPATSRKQARVDWKGRYARFQAEVPTFRDPFMGAEITEVDQPDEIAYSRCTLRTDLLNSATTCDVYLEIEVLANPDNVSLAVVDFEAGGCSSVTFSPDTGAVIRERKVCELPRKVQGAYIQPLTTITPGRGFEGSVGIFLSRGQLAFFRRHAASTEDGQELELGTWESTGFVTDLSWAEGRRLTPCLAFRNEGAYQVRVVCVCSKPPLMPELTAMAYDEASWSSLNWDADQEMMEAMGEV